jgi:magnesium chelatase subunit I
MILTTPMPTPVPTPTPAATAPPHYPFSALVGQPRLQQALLLAATDPAIGGVLISGPRGTAKSTAARALAALLPGRPFVTLPLAASLEQLVGTLDVDRALQGEGLRFKPGLLARAHGGVLYVDEVNLLPDALVDALLDAAASGWHTVERDGISQQHASRFVLVGTMNPEEGELRPQLLDRFGLALTLANPADAAARQAIVRERLAFERHPQALLETHAADELRLVQQLAAAQARLPALDWPEPVLARAAALAHAAGVDGLRADLTMLRAARALAALAGRDAVQADDVDAVAELALAHRRARTQAVPPPGPAPDAASGQASAEVPAGRAEGTDNRPHGSSRTDSDRGTDGDWGALPPQPVGFTPTTLPGDPWRPKP